MSRMYIWLTNWKKGTTKIIPVDDKAKKGYKTEKKPDSYYISEEDGQMYLYRLRTTKEGNRIAELVGPCGENLREELENRKLLA